MHSLQVYTNSSLFMYLQTLSHAWKQRYESHPTTICTFSSEKKKKKYLPRIFSTKIIYLQSFDLAILNNFSMYVNVPFITSSGKRADSKNWQSRLAQAFC